MNDDSEFNIDGVTPGESSDALFLTKDLNGLCSMSAALVERGVRSVCLYSPALDINLFGQPALVDACSAFARSDRRASLYLLISDSTSLLEQSHPLVRLQQRLSDKIQLRCLPKNFDPENIHKLARTFIVADETGLMVQHSPESWMGFVNFDDKPKAREFHQQFIYLWNHGEIINQLQRLGI